MKEEVKEARQIRESNYWILRQEQQKDAPQGAGYEMVTEGVNVTYLQSG